MRGVGGSLPGGGGASDARACGGEPGEGPGGGVRARGAGGEPDPQTAVCGSGDRAGVPQTGAGASAGGTHASLSSYSALIHWGAALNNRPVGFYVF
ncbi:hypothetical protein PO909_028568 [Leuciscus waleckii]